MTAKVGGVPLLLSILKWHFREQDSPKLWLSQLRQWGLSLRLANSFQWLQSLNLYKVLGNTAEINLVFNHMFYSNILCDSFLPIYFLLSSSILRPK